MTCRRRRAFAMTDTELRLIGALATIGLRSNPRDAFARCLAWRRASSRCSPRKLSDQLANTSASVREPAEWSWCSVPTVDSSSTVRSWSSPIALGQARFPRHIVLLGERHLRAVVREFVEHYRAERNHWGLGKSSPSRPAVRPRLRPHRPTQKLSGMLSFFERNAARMS